MHIELSTLTAMQVYATMTQTIVPRPIAWVLSDNGDESYNLAPFSYFAALSSDPPMVCISVGLRPDNSIKDTRVNLEARKHFVLHIAHQDMAPQVTATSATMPAGVSEIEASHLSLAPMPGSDLPRLADCRVAYSADMVDIHMIGEQAILFAELKHLYLADDIVEEDAKGRLKVNALSLDPLGRLGGGEYLTAGKLISLVRPA